MLGGLLGVGGGFLMVPLQVMLTRTPQLQANATSLAAIVPISIAAALVYYFGTGSPAVNLHIALFLTTGGVAGAFLGARLSDRLPERTLGMAVALLLGLVGLKELLFP